MFVVQICSSINVDMMKKIMNMLLLLDMCEYYINIMNINM